MKPARLLFAVAVIAASLVCVRLGFWQLSRWGEKRERNHALRTALAAPPREARGALPALDQLRDRPIRLTGRFDPRFQFLIRGQIRAGEPGVRVATPFVLDADSIAVIVDRGWLAADDAATVEARAIPDDPSPAVAGMAAAFETRPNAPPLRAIGSGERNAWSAAWLDLDTLRARLPYEIAPIVLTALPGNGAPGSPLRDTPRGAGEGMHLGYAFQWFGIAILIPLVAGFAARGRLRSRTSGGIGRSA